MHLFGRPDKPDKRLPRYDQSEREGVGLNICYVSTSKFVESYLSPSPCVEGTKGIGAKLKIKKHRNPVSIGRESFEAS